MVAGGAFYWLNDCDIIISADDATFFDPHVSYGLTSALEPIGLARRIPLGEALRWALLLGEPIGTTPGSGTRSARLRCLASRSSSPSGHCGNSPESTSRAHFKSAFPETVRMTLWTTTMRRGFL